MSSYQWMIQKFKRTGYCCSYIIFSFYNYFSSLPFFCLVVRSAETHKWDFKIPRAVLRFWQPLLGSLHSRHFTQTLLEKMFNDLKAHARISSLRSQYLINWITKILKANLRASKYWDVFGQDLRFGIILFIGVGGWWKTQLGTSQVFPQIFFDMAFHGISAKEILVSFPCSRFTGRTGVQKWEVTPCNTRRQLCLWHLNLNLYLFRLSSWVW